MSMPRTLLLRRLPRQKPLTALAPAVLPPANGRRGYTAATTTPRPPALSPIAESLRTCMRSLPHPVIILTAASTTTPGHGITLSTLTCLSLAPHPLVTFNIKTPSATSAAMHAAGRFTVHILRTAPHSAHLANAFAQLGADPSGKRSPWAELKDRGEAPMLGERDGVLSRWSCEKVKVVQVEDHEIWVGRVEKVERFKDGWGLMYANRRFRRVGAEVVAELDGKEVRVGEEEEFE